MITHTLSQGVISRRAADCYILHLVLFAITVHLSYVASACAITHRTHFHRIEQNNGVAPGVNVFICESRRGCEALRIGECHRHHRVVNIVVYDEDEEVGD